MRDALFYSTCMCFFYLKCIVGVEVVNPELNDYLNKKSEATQDTILEKLKEEIGSIEMEEVTRSDHISGGYKCVFSLFNDTFILLDNELYSLGLSNGVINLKKIKELEDKGNITFTKVTQFEDLGFILIKTEMDIDIYAFQDDNIFFVHSIFAPYSSDAVFFINQNSLYLILVNNRGDNLAISIIYKWLETYFDETESIITTGAIKVASFTNNFFEIIIILQYSSNVNLLSTVYEFNFGRLKKIQHIKSSNPSHMDVFQSTTETYVLVFEKSKTNLLYAWNGSKLVKISQFQTETVINKSVTITSNNTPIMAVPLKDKIQTLFLLPKEKLIGEKIKSNYSLILDIHKKKNSNHIYVVGLNKNNTMYISVVLFKARFNAIGNQDNSKDSLRNCFNALENSVYSKKAKLKKTKQILSQVKVSPDRSRNTFRSLDATEIDSSPEYNLNKLRMRLDELQDILNDYQDKYANNNVINKTVIIKGSVEANNLIGKDVNLKEINGFKWTPQYWLRYKEPQNITGPIKVGKIIATELNTTTSNPLFTELLTKNEDQDIWGEFNIINLTANKILTKTINDIEFNDVYLKSDQRPIQGLKIFENLHTTKAKINILNGQPDVLSQLKTHSSPKSSTFDHLLEIENLLVDTINNIQWNTFRDSVFRIGITKEINGDLILQEFKANNITLKTLKGVKVEDLLTTSTDQVIDADIEFGKIFANDITTNTTNDIKLPVSAVQFENNTLVEVPVKFGKLHVKNIELIGKLDEEFFLWNGDHIKGTNASDLSQSYKEVVKIKGNLYVTNFTLQQSGKLFLGEEEFNPDIGSIYWTKNTAQSIPIHFEAQNGLNVPFIRLNKLNDIDFNRYMLNKDENRFETSYHFENISILGDVVLDANTSHTPNLIKLKEETVKTTGSYHIKGKKIYTDLLNTEDLEATTLNGVAVNETLTPESVANVTEKLNFKNVIIKGNLTCNLESIEFINGVNITYLLETAIYIDEPQNIKKLHFENVTVRDLWVTKLNNYHVNHFIENVNNVFSSNNINSITVNGNVVLNKIIGVLKINDNKFEELLNNTWKQGKSGGIMVNLEFIEPVKVDNLITARINHLNLRKLSKRFLYRNVDQNVTALYSFENIKADNLAVSKINDISMKNLVDVSATTRQTIYAPDKIEFGSVILQKSLKVSNSSPCNLVETLKQINDPPTRDWNNIDVKGNATFLDPDNILYRVFENAVTDNTDNIIKAPVLFSQHILATNVITKGFFNDVNLQEILDDAVLSESQEEQIITGRKTFTTMKISEAAVQNNADIPVVNKIDIPELNKFIVRKDDIRNNVIIGKKTFFGGLQCNNLYTEKISNIVVENIVTTEKLKKIQQAAFDFVEVENNLNISSINSFDFDGFLKTRLLTDGVDEQTVDGVYFFDNIQVEDMRVPSINHITMDNVVFDIGPQNITVSKQFTKTVEVFGNLSCPYINGINISEIHKKSVGDDNIIKGSLTILRPSIVKGNITTEYINGYPVEQIKEILNQGTIKSEIEKIRHIKVDIVDKIKRNIDHIKFLASDYMYIEKTQALQISVPNIISAHAMETNGYVLIHVNGEESGENCGLLENCKCPVQYSIEVSPEHSVAIFPNKGTQRIFTYENDGMIIHFLTNSFSTDSKCRAEHAKVINEVSMITWNTPARGNTTGGFHQYNQYITGYISGAEFFTLHGYTYAIIGRYYNPTTNSHDLDCYLIKFSHDKSTAKKIQQIPTAGAWSVYLFHTAQGVTLIIGNIKIMNKTHQSEEETKVYRFNEQKQMFDLLRIVPSYGCSMATGVVLGTDSLIVLAHRYAPLRVLKYNPNFDNYYFYQSFELEAPVVGISVFYTGGFGISDAYLCTVTANENYFIYSYRFIEGWMLESSGELEGLKDLIPFELNKQSYLFAPSSKVSSLLTVVKHGSV